MAEAAPPIHTTYDDVDAPPNVQAHPTAKIHAAAHVGTPAEWIDIPTRFPAVIGAGVVIRETARVHAGCERPTRIGEGTLVMSGAHIGHDAQIGARCRIAPNAVVCGLVTIGNEVKVGAGAVIKQGVSIGDNVVIGAQAMVTRDIPSGETWSGVPAKRMHTWKPTVVR